MHLSLFSFAALASSAFALRVSDFYGPRQPAEQVLRRETSSNDTSGFRYYTSKTEPFRVESLPDVPFDVGELYSGLVPIHDDDSRALFFTYKPTTGEPVDEVTVWFNGGPGCSSLQGFFQENGPWVWQPGTFQPIENPYTWVNLTNMLWVDQPISTGFSVGTSKATTQDETAAEFISWFKNWQELFGIKNYKIYLTGESYAGRYVPYIGAAMLDKNNTKHFNLSGALAYDATIGSFVYSQAEAVTVPYILKNNNVLNLNKSFVKEMVELHESCGYKDYVDTYLTFPPAGVQPPKFFNYSSDDDLVCDVFDIVNEALTTVNPCYNVYEAVQQCPLLWDPLNSPTQLLWQPEGAPTAYFNRSDVKAAIHAPADVEWVECALTPTYVGDEGTSGPEQQGDNSPDPIQSTLPRIIEATNRVLIANGDYDMIVITNGTLLSIQNMTWNGELGFQHKPHKHVQVDIPDMIYTAAFAENGYEGFDGPQGVTGIQHHERGLMWVETFQAGHQEPMYQPRSSYRHLEWVLGRRDSI